MAKIKVANPIVELDGDEMTRIIWAFIKDQLILPYLDLELVYFDLGIESRDATSDQITVDAANAIKEHGVGQMRDDHAGRGPGRGVRPEGDVPLAERDDHPGWRHLREPIVISNVPRLVPGWTKPIIIGRHAFGDQYRATDTRIPGNGKLMLSFQPNDGSEPLELEVFDFPEGGGDGDVQPRRLDPRLRPRLVPLRARPRLPGLHVDQEHDLEDVRRALQGPVRGGVRRRVQVRVRRGRRHLRAPAHRRHGRRCAQVGGRLRVGVQELRRRRPVRHGRPGLWVARADDERPDDPGRQDRRGRGRPRHRHPSLPRASEGQPHLNPIASIFAWTRGLHARGRMDQTPEVENFAESLERVCVETVESGR